ncbi:MAG: hypothetical protein JNN27_09010 [Planctomycetes bacterium]|nr:hypothetical protein [Planctomycetota bacterium]
MPKSTPLADEVAKVAERVRKATKGKLNEQNTKASMIEPVLREFGCSLRRLLNRYAPHLHIAAPCLPVS